MLNRKGIWELDYLTVLRNAFKGVLSPRDNPLLRSSSNLKGQKEVMLLAFSSVGRMQQTLGPDGLSQGSSTLIVTEFPGGLHRVISPV